MSSLREVQPGVIRKPPSVVSGLLIGCVGPMIAYHRGDVLVVITR